MQANQMRIMPYLDIRDNLLDSMKTRPDAYSSAKDAGYLHWPNRAAMDDRTRAGLDAGYNFGQQCGR